MTTSLSLRRRIVHVIEDSLYKSPVVCREEGDERILIWIRTRSSDGRNDRVRKDSAGLLE